MRLTCPLLDVELEFPQIIIANEMTVVTAMLCYSLILCRLVISTGLAKELIRMCLMRLRAWDQGSKLVCITCY